MATIPSNSAALIGQHLSAAFGLILDQYFESHPHLFAAPAAKSAPNYKKRPFWRPRPISSDGRIFAPPQRIPSVVSAPDGACCPLSNAGNTPEIGPDGAEIRPSHDLELTPLPINSSDGRIFSSSPRFSSIVSAPGGAMGPLSNAEDTTEIGLVDAEIGPSHGLDGAPAHNYHDKNDFWPPQSLIATEVLAGASPNLSLVPAENDIKFNCTDTEIAHNYEHGHHNGDEDIVHNAEAENETSSPAYPRLEEHHTLASPTEPTPGIEEVTGPPLLTPSPPITPTPETLPSAEVQPHQKKKRKMKTKAQRKARLLEEARALPNHLLHRHFNTWFSRYHGIAWEAYEPTPLEELLAAIFEANGLCTCNPMVIKREDLYPILRGVLQPQ